MSAAASPGESMNTFVYASPPLKSSKAGAAKPSESVAPPAAKSGWGGVIAAILLLALGGGGAAGYLMWQKMEKEKVADKEAARERLEADMRQVAYQSEVRMFEDWNKTQRASELKKRDNNREALVLAMKTGTELRHEKNWDKALQTVEDAIKNHNGMAQTMRR